MAGTSDRFRAAITAMDAENARDPHREAAGGAEHPKELLYAQRLTEWVERLAPNASEELLLAARGLHICRWTIPRDTYPKDRNGYFRWRNTLKRFHADKVGGILREVGYAPHVVERVCELIRTKSQVKDEESRVLEDGVSLLFLEHQFAEFSRRTERGQMIEILRKVWEKMTPRARAIALELPLDEPERELVAAALSPASPASGP
jgi:hypothetical protein